MGTHHGGMQSPPTVTSEPVQVEPKPLSLGAISGQPLVIVFGHFPELFQFNAWREFWHSPVAEWRVAGENRICALAESPESAPVIRSDSPMLDACGVMHLMTDVQRSRYCVADIADLSRHLVLWSERRCAYWHRLVNKGVLPLAVRQAFMQWIAPLERRLRDELILALWRQSLQGEILPSPAFGTGHAMTLPLVRWMTAPKALEVRLRRRDMFRQARGIVVLCLALVPSVTVPGQEALRLLSRLCERAKRKSKRQIAKVLAPTFGLPSWAIRRVMGLEWCAETGPAEVVLEALQRLSRQLPAAAWPRDVLSMEHALRCLKAMNGMLCFGLFDCEAWPADQPIPARIRRWMLRELRVNHGGDWERFAEALEAQEPRYQPLVWMLPDLAHQWWHVYWDEPDDMERISAPWRTASPEWWLRRLPQWWAKVTARNDAHLGLGWRPMFVGRRQHGQRLVHCMHSVTSVRRLLARKGFLHLVPWIGPSLIARAQWLLFEDAQDKLPRSLALLHATTRQGELLVELIAHVSLEGKDAPPLDCARSLQLLWKQWEECHWGVLARVENEELLKEDEEMCTAVERTRIRLWHSVSKIECTRAG